MSYRSTIGGAVSTIVVIEPLPVDLFTTNNNNKLRHSRKMANEEQDEATSLYISFVMSRVQHEPSLLIRPEVRVASCILHRVVCFFSPPATTTVISSPSTSGSIHCVQVRLVRLSYELSWSLNRTARNPIWSNILSD